MFGKGVASSCPVCEFLHLAILYFAKVFLNIFRICVSSRWCTLFLHRTISTRFLPAEFLFGILILRIGSADFCSASEIMKLAPFYLAGARN